MEWNRIGEILQHLRDATADDQATLSTLTHVCILHKTIADVYEKLQPYVRRVKTKQFHARLQTLDRKDDMQSIETLIQQGADINAPFIGPKNISMTPVLFAFLYNHARLLQLLAEYNADIKPASEQYKRWGGRGAAPP